jgi:23S rRNA (uracil1939-C5)-methyltransferase
MDGKAVFVPFALPGETCEIEITESKKDYAFARLVSVLEPSPRRVEPRCPLFGRCGGCTLQMADDGYQSELRKSILENALSRARVRAEQGVAVVSGDPWGYRSRFQFHKTPNGGIGFSEGGSSAVIEMTDCPVANRTCRDAIADGSIARNARKNPAGNRFHVFGHQDRLWQEGIDEACEVPVAGTTIRFNVKGFFQSNIPMLEALIGAITAVPVNGNPRFSGERLLDFYSGVGTFSATTGRDFAETVLVEHNREALETARTNLEGSSGKAILCATSDARWPGRPESRLPYDCAIVDPPRLGIDRATLDWIVASNIKDLRSVSCDPVTFARDAARLVAGGFALREVTLFDFYPQTHHIETLAFFAR